MIKPDGVKGNYFDNLVISLGENEGDYTAYILRYISGINKKSKATYKYQGMTGYIEHYPLTETSFGLDFIDNSFCDFLVYF